MTDRRSFLRLAAATGSGLTVGLAGCVGDDDDDADDTDVDPATDEETDDEEDDIDEAEAQSNLDDAIDTLIDNRDEIDSIHDDEIELSDELRADLDAGLAELEDQVSAMEGRIDDVSDGIQNARSSLDDAEGVAPDEMTDRIDSVRAVAAFQESQMDLAETTLAATEHLETGDLYDDAEEDDVAVQEFEAALDLMDDIRSGVDAAELARDDIDHDTLDESELEYTDPDIYTYLGIDKEGDIDVMELFIEGRRDLAQGWLHLGGGEGEWQQGNVEAAQSEWTAGLEVAESAHDTFEDLTEHPEADAEFQEFAGIFQWIAGVQWETLGMFMDAVDAALDGEEELAIDLHQDAWNHLEESFEE